MTVETARTVFFAVAGAMWLVWVAGTRFAFSRLRSRSREGEACDRPEDADAADALTGEAAVRGDPELISKKVAEQLLAVNSVVKQPASNGPALRSAPLECAILRRSGQFRKTTARFFDSLVANLEHIV